MDGVDWEGGGAVKYPVRSELNKVICLRITLARFSSRKSILMRTSCFRFVYLRSSSSTRDERPDADEFRSPSYL